MSSDTNRVLLNTQPLLLTEVTPENTKVCKWSAVPSGVYTKYL